MTSTLKGVNMSQEASSSACSAAQESRMLWHMRKKEMHWDARLTRTPTILPRPCRSRGTQTASMTARTRTHTVQGALERLRTHTRPKGEQAADTTQQQHGGGGRAWINPPTRPPPKKRAPRLLGASPFPYGPCRERLLATGQDSKRSEPACDGVRAAHLAPASARSSQEAAQRRGSTPPSSLGVRHAPPAHLHTPHACPSETPQPHPNLALPTRHHSVSGRPHRFATAPPRPAGRVHDQRAERHTVTRDRPAHTLGPKQQAPRPPHDLIAR